MGSRCACGLMTLPDVCRCEHLEQSHDLNKRGERTACSVSSGPTAVRCGCKKFEEEVAP
jgi:hypothetical protein